MKRKYIKSVTVIISFIIITVFIGSQTKSINKEIVTANFTQDFNASNNKLISAADNFLKSLNKDQYEEILFDFDDEERFNWHYVPRSREGIPLKELNIAQRELVDTLLNISLSKKGFNKTQGVIILEEILKENAGFFSPSRDPELYYITFFGTPKLQNPWAWRFEGHHISLNFTIIGDSIQVYTPMFLGANPAEVKSGPHKGLRVLAPEEDLGRTLVKSLNYTQLKKALINERAPSEIITGNDRKANPLNPKGINAKELNEDQADLFFELIDTYISNSPSEKAKERLNKILNEEKKDLYFAWAGSTEKGRPHYYRIQGKTFLIEYDNTQNSANHIHSVWRDFDGDFGKDLLLEHYKNNH